MLIGRNEENEIKGYFSSLIDSLNEIDTHHKVYTVIVKIQNNEYSVGRKGKSGSYDAYYSTKFGVIISNNLFDILSKKYSIYKYHNPAKYTLFFRYNSKKKELKVFNDLRLKASSQVE